MRTAHNLRARFPAIGADGFTLIEVMVVVGILGMLLAMGMPAFIQSIRKDPLRQAVSDIEEACSKARGANGSLDICARGVVGLPTITAPAPDRRAACCGDHH